MNNRDPIIEEKQGFLSGMLGAFAQKTEAIINNTMDEVNKVVQAGQPKPSLQQEISQIQTTQQNFIIMLIIQFSLSLVVIGIFLFIEQVHIFQSVAFIVWAIFLIVYILTLAIAQFSGETVQKNPQNVFLFSVNTILRTLWMSYLVVLVQFIKFELIALIFLVDLVLILIFFKIDQNSKINNCFLVSKQPWRLTFILLGELLLVGLILPIEDFPTAFLWTAIIFVIYAFILLDIQLIEWRKFMRSEGNAWFLATACFDSDIIFPCFFLQHHCTCLEFGNPSIMRD